MNQDTPTHKANALEGLTRARDILKRPLIGATVPMLMGLIEYIGAEVTEIDELKRPRRKRKAKPLADPGAVGHP